MSNVYTHSQRRPLRMGVIPIQSEKAAVQSASLGLKCITSNTDNDMQAKDRYHRWDGIGVLPAFFFPDICCSGHRCREPVLRTGSLGSRCERYVLYVETFGRDILPMWIKYGKAGSTLRYAVN